MMDNKGICAKQTTVAVIINGGKAYYGTNWCASPQHECPRKEFPTGVGYELCKSICKQKYHAEVDACINAGDNANGGTLYMIGHYYCCDDCIRVMKQYGIKRVVVVKDVPSFTF